MRRRIIAILVCFDVAVMAVIALTAVDLSRSAVDISRRAAILSRTVVRSETIGHVACAVIETERRYGVASRVLLRGA